MLHHRLPVGSCHFCYQHVPLLEDQFVPGYLLLSLSAGKPLLQGASTFEHLSVRAIGPDWPGSYPLADGLAGGNHRVSLESVNQRAVHLVANQSVRGLAVHRLRSGLDDVQAAVLPVLGPLYVHGHPVVVLNAQGHVRQALALL